MGKIFNHKKILILILIITTFLRLFRLDYPNKYVFDEVYHAFTAKEYLKGNKEAWEWWTKPPPGVAFEWTHPPLAKELMTISMFILNTQNAWAYRLPGALLGVLSVYLVYLLGIKLLKNQVSALIASFVFSIDGLNFVQSRTGMNDIYYVTFILISLLFFLNRKFFLSAIFFGLAFASKWAAVYLGLMYLAILTFLFIKYKTGIFKKLDITKTSLIRAVLYFFSIPFLVYLTSYIPFFLLGHNFEQFAELQRQMWWYHTHLKATHAYSSPWWSWPLNLYPVWYFVDYLNNSIANIFTSGNPIFFWTGSAAIILTTLEAIIKRSKGLAIISLGFFMFWLPWSISPRIMFLYHFSPSVPFLSLATGYQLTLIYKEKNFKALILLLGLMFISFILIFPFLTGIPIPREFVKLFFLLNLTKNPF